MGVSRGSNQQGAQLTDAPPPADERSHPTADLTTGPASGASSDVAPDPPAIAAFLDRVMRADVEDLVAAVSAAHHARTTTVDGNSDSRSLDDRVDRVRVRADLDSQLDLDLPQPAPVDEVSRRRLARAPDAIPQAGPLGPFGRTRSVTTTRVRARSQGPRPRFRWAGDRC